MAVLEKARAGLLVALSRHAQDHLASKTTYEWKDVGVVERWGDWSGNEDIRLSFLGLQYQSPEVHQFQDQSLFRSSESGLDIAECNPPFGYVGFAPCIYPEYRPQLRVKTVSAFQLANEFGLLGRDHYQVCREELDNAFHSALSDKKSESTRRAERNQTLVAADAEVLFHRRLIEPKLFESEEDGC
jgi:hypothetical protein